MFTESVGVASTKFLRSPSAVITIIELFASPPPGRRRQGRNLHHPVSIGVACHADGETVETVLNRADEALYEAKRTRSRIGSGRAYRPSAVECLPQLAGAGALWLGTVGPGREDHPARACRVPRRCRRGQWLLPCGRGDRRRRMTARGDHASRSASRVASRIWRFCFCTITPYQPRPW
ncbi:MAG: diguanylate cyclase [Alphaproteobacteria bacterium]|nr:diguanylate cyclase [Alphaproteobacteria bacterium]